MNSRDLQELKRRIVQESTDALNLAGRGLTAFARLWLVIALYVLVATCGFIGILDDQLREEEL